MNLEALPDKFGVVVFRDDDDAKSRVFCFNLRDDFKTIHDRHVKIQ